MAKKLLLVESENIIEKLECCSDKERATNQALINMLENSGLEKVGIEPSKTGKSFNRGSLAECIIRASILQYLGFSVEEIRKSVNGLDINLCKRNKELLKDLGLDNLSYEIKLLTSLSRASKIEKDNQAKVIMVDLRKKSFGIWLVNRNDLVLYQNCNPKDNAYNSIKDYNKGAYLELLSELVLG